VSTRDYENFDLLIEAQEAGQYRARVTSCPVGDTPASPFSLPFGPTELENLLLKVDPGRSGMRRVVGRQTQASIDLGGGLFDAVFRDGVLVAWSRSKDAARQEGRGLRLRLRLTGAPDLAAMPWELLYDKSARMFYAQSDRTPVVRYLDVTNPPHPLMVRGPLRILAVIASPRGLPRLDVEREWATICEALAEKERARLVRVDRLPAPTIGGLQRWLRHDEVHVLHFVGHGYFDDQAQDGALMFSDPDGHPAPISSAVLGAHVRDHDPLRLVVLNACQSARVDDADPYSGMAQGLIQQEAAAVVAMQFPISDDAAIVFSREFYGAVADGEPLDQAMASTRKALLADHGAEWATPVLFLRATDGRIFDRPSPPPGMYEATGPAVPGAGVPEGGVELAGVPASGVPASGVPASGVPASGVPVAAARRPPPGRPPGRAGSGPPRRHGWYWTAVAAAVVLAIGATAVALERSHAPRRLAHSGPAVASPATHPAAHPATSSPGIVVLSYRKYTNKLFGFTTLWPSSFRPQPEPSHGPGQAWVSPDGQATLHAYGAFNKHGYSPQQDEAARSRGLDVVYHVIDGNVVTVSGYQDNGRTIVYRRDVVGSGAIDTLYWRYPTSEQAEWKAAVIRTADTFRPGYLLFGQTKAAPSYDRYTNLRFGFAALYPSAFRGQSPPADGQGQSWVSPNGHAFLSVYGTNNINGYSPGQDEAAAGAGLAVQYRHVQGNIVTVSGYQDNGATIVYRRDFVGPGSIDTVYWRYPTSEQAAWAAAVTRTADGFHPGDLTRAG
jgi:CHAT domain